MTITVTASEVPSFLKGAWPDADVNAALSWASSAIESYCERDFSYVVNDVVTIDPFPVRRSAQLPNPPVISVSKVEAFMRDNTGATSWQELTNYAYTSDGLLYDTSGLPGVNVAAVPTWPSLPKGLRVTYTHGYQTLPLPLVDAVIKAAGNYLANPFGNTRRTTGDVQSDWAVTLIQAGGLDETLLAKYRLITVTR